ncbi:hypothetical protein J4217_01480 [Candidatus Pacearchaeota archaeon]|nr:hypothetical protein [Candidatus Pacearchaeota archaeon]
MEKDIDRIAKNNDTDIVIRVDDFGGKRGVTIREFVKGERYTGFTKAGTRIPADKFSLFKKAINSINEKELMEFPVQDNQQVSSGKKEDKKQFKEKKPKPADESEDMDEFAM